MNRWAKLGIVVLVLAIVAYIAYSRGRRWHDETLDSALERQDDEWAGKIEKLKVEMAELEKEVALRREEVLPEKKLEEVFGEDAQAVSPVVTGRTCEELDRQMEDLFAYLDGKDYVKRTGKGEGTLELYRASVALLSEHLPLIIGETKDPYRLIQNVAHFYRVLGKHRLYRVRAILDSEGEILESAASLYFEWAMAGERCQTRVEGRPSLETMYSYASFFLNTLAGKTYLQRRDSRTRILTTYYSVRVLDRANDGMLNRYGIDIRPHIAAAIREIRDQRGLAYQKHYLDILEGLEVKYAPGRKPAGKT